MHFYLFLSTEQFLIFGHKNLDPDLFTKNLAPDSVAGHEILLYS
jgi:hypothetical protein